MTSGIVVLFPALTGLAVGLALERAALRLRCPSVDAQRPIRPNYLGPPFPGSSGDSAVLPRPIVASVESPACRRFYGTSAWGPDGWRDRNQGPGRCARAIPQRAGTSGGATRSTDCR